MNKSIGKCQYCGNNFVANEQGTSNGSFSYQGEVKRCNACCKVQTENAPAFDKVPGPGAPQYTFAPAPNAQLSLL